MILGLVLAALALVLDQLSKWWIVAVVMQPPETIEVTGFFNIVLAFNRGVAFSLLRGGPERQTIVLIALAVAISAGLIYWMRRTPQALLRAAFGLIVGGALGNALDRVRHGAVVDFLDFHLGVYHWPAFNLADSAIFCGVALILAESLFKRRQSST